MKRTRRSNVKEVDRVRRSTRPEVQAQIDEEIEESIRFYANQPLHVIEARIKELDRSWSIERWIETNASTLALTGLALGFLRGRRWLFLTGGVLSFLLQHAIQGWCPPIPLLRKLGIRTRGEIDREKYALKALRGDFEDVRMKKHAPQKEVEQVLEAIET